MQDFEYGENSVLGWGNRGWLEIIEHILTICMNDTIKTHIMYKCNLNSKQIQQYLIFLLNSKLLEIDQESADSNRRVFKTTAKGRKYIDAYGKIAEIFKPSKANNNHKFFNSK